MLLIEVWSVNRLAKWCDLKLVIGSHLWCSERTFGFIKLTKIGEKQWGGAMQIIFVKNKTDKSCWALIWAFIFNVRDIIYMCHTVKQWALHNHNTKSPWHSPNFQKQQNITDIISCIKMNWDTVYDSLVVITNHIMMLCHALVLDLCMLVAVYTYFQGKVIQISSKWSEMTKEESLHILLSW